MSKEIKELKKKMKTIPEIRKNFRKLYSEYANKINETNEEFKKLHEKIGDLAKYSDETLDLMQSIMEARKVIQ